AERDQLLKALDALTGGSSPVRRRGRPPRSGSASGNGRRRSGRRAPRGQRREQVLAVLEGKELGPSAIAREVGVNPTQISSLLRQLASEGRVTRTARPVALDRGGRASRVAGERGRVGRRSAGAGWRRRRAGLVFVASGGA